MPLIPELEEKLKSGTYNKDTLDISNLNLTDAEFLPIINLFDLNPSIKAINLRNNLLTKASWTELAKNTTLTQIRLTANLAITSSALKPFEMNTSLTKIIGARSKILLKQLSNNSKNKVIVDENDPEQSYDEIIAKEQASLIAIASGEASFQQLINSFIFDLADFNSNTDFIVWYGAVALNCYMHNASHAPLAKFSSVQDREEKAKLYYSRSQDKHPSARRNDAFIKNVVAKEQEVKIGELRNRGVGVLNPTMVKLLNSSIGDNNPVKGDKRSVLLSNLNSINPGDGFPKKDKKIKDYFSLALAHGGLRSNNISATTNILKTSISNADNQALELSDLLVKHASVKKLKSTTRDIQKLAPELLVARIKAYYKKFKQISIDKSDVLSNLQAKVLQFKKTRSESLCLNFSEWSVNKDNPIELELYGDGCLLVNIKQELLKIPSSTSETKKQQVTEVLIGFLAGLINHQIAINDLSLWVERRQSFGFNLSTVTDVGSLKIRLSHGLEPNLFDDVLLKSLKLFYKAIKQDCKFEPILQKMRSEDKQWRASFEAQYYLQRAQKDNQSLYVKKSFDNYIKHFGVDNTFNINAPYDADDNFIKYPKVKHNSDNVFNQSPIFAVLQNSLSYAIALACCLDVEQIDLSLQFKQSYLHSQGKLYLHCINAKELLTKINSNDIEVSKAFQQANMLLEDIVEYSILLDNLHAIKAKETNIYIDPTIEFCQTESKYIASTFKVKQENIDVYFTDSGQQAIVSTVLALDLELLLNQKQDNRVDANFYNFGNSYFEVTSFINDIGWQLTTKATAKLTFIDVTKLEQFSFEDFACINYLVIDVTQQPLFTDKLKLIIAQAQKSGIVIALVTSCLKHDELGLDKYTSGKITIIKPDDISLHDEVGSLFNAISDDSNNHAVRSYLNMVNKICGDKFIELSDKSILSYKGSFFAPPVSDNAKEEPTAVITKAL